MNREQGHISTELLSKFLLGEVSDVEQLQVIEWLDKDPAHQKELDELEQTWILTGDLNPAPVAVDTLNAWGALSDRMDAYDQVDKGSSGFIKPIWYAAASIALLVLVFNLFRTKEVIFEPVIVSNLVEGAHTDTLPDGSIVTLNAHSRLSYLSQADDPQRRMVLEGEAFFEVVKDSLRPFIIKAGMGGVRVLGTSFNVKISRQTDVRVDVKTGRVELFYPVSNSTDTLKLELNAGESGELSHRGQQLVTNTYGSSALFWKDRTLVFKNQALSEVFEIIEKCYGVSVYSNDPLINYLNLSTSFKDDDITQVLDVIAATFDISYQLKDNQYIFFKP